MQNKVPRLSGTSLFNEITKRYNEAEKKVADARERDDYGMLVRWLTRQSDSAWLLSRLAGDSEWDRISIKLGEELSVAMSRSRMYRVA